MHLENNQLVDYHQLQIDLFTLYYKKINRPELIHTIEESFISTQITEFDIYLSLKSVHNYFRDYEENNCLVYNYDNFDTPKSYSVGEISNHLFDMSIGYCLDAECDCKDARNCDDCVEEYELYLNSFLESLPFGEFGFIFETNQDLEEYEESFGTSNYERYEEKVEDTKYGKVLYFDMFCLN